MDYLEEKVFCPYFNDNVIFDRRGLEHIKRKSNGILRKPIEYEIRFKLLDYAKQIIKLSHIVQGISYIDALGKRFYTKEHPLLHPHGAFYEFIGHIEGIRMKVIIRDSPRGKFFWSVIPFW